MNEPVYPFTDEDEKVICDVRGYKTFPNKLYLGFSSGVDIWIFECPYSLRKIVLFIECANITSSCGWFWNFADKAIIESSVYSVEVIQIIRTFLENGQNYPSIVVLNLGDICPKCKTIYKERILLNSVFTGCMC